MKAINADRILTRRWPYGSAALVYYVRPGGDDNNSGLSAVDAFATLSRALHFMAIADVNVSVVIDVTGMAISASEVLNLGGTTLGAINFDLDVGATAPNNFYSRRQRQIRSELVLSTPLTVTGQSFDAVSGILRLTVSDALIANSLQGLFAVGSVLGEFGNIQSNTGGVGPNTIEVANITGLTGPIGAYNYGATLQFGDAGNFFEQALYLNSLCDWNFQGLRITSNGPKTASVTVFPVAPVNFTLCRLDGVQLLEGPGVVTVDGCYVTGTWAQDGATASVRQSFFHNVTFLCHGSGASGLNEWIGNIMQGCSPFGGGNVESRYTFEAQNVRITGGADEGVHARFGVSRLRNVTIDNQLKSAIDVTGTTTLVLDNVQGSGNAGFGVVATYGAMVRRAGGTAVTGTTNDVFVGALGALAWAATPATDPDQLVRVGV